MADMDVNSIRNDFSFFKNNEGMVYMDNSATTQHPDRVIEREGEFYRTVNSNPLRGLYRISLEATKQYESARKTVADFVGAGQEEIIFTRNATESLNLLAFCLGEMLISQGDEIAVGIVEHHSNMLPWRQMAERKGASIKYIECGQDGSITDDQFLAAVNEHTKIVSLAWISNVFGRKYDVEHFAQICHDRGIIFVADGAQSVPHIKTDVRKSNVDFLVFSGHKMLAPMGIGVLYGRKEWLQKMPPFLTGGEMINQVSLDDVTYAEIPHKFEAGTVNAAGAAALAEAINYIEEIGIENIEERERNLSVYMMDRLSEIPHINIIGSRDGREHHGIFSFTLDGVHPHDVAAILDEENICIRAGHHCAQPLLKYLGVMSTARASLAFYNTEEEIDRLADALVNIRRQMGYGE